jgi:hypothetical protein
MKSAMLLGKKYFWAGGSGLAFNTKIPTFYGCQASKNQYNINSGSH